MFIFTRFCIWLLAYPVGTVQVHGTAFACVFSERENGGLGPVVPLPLISFTVIKMVGFDLSSF